MGSIYRQAALLNPPASSAPMLAECAVATPSVTRTPGDDSGAPRAWPGGHMHVGCKRSALRALIERRVRLKLPLSHDQRRAGEQLGIAMPVSSDTPPAEEPVNSMSSGPNSVNQSVCAQSTSADAVAAAAGNSAELGRKTSMELQPYSGSKRVLNVHESNSVMEDQSVRGDGGIRVEESNAVEASSAMASQTGW